MIELKPCPFCGGEAKIYSATTSGYPKYPKAHCYCERCHASSAAFTDTEQNGTHILNASEAWNRRASDG